MDRRGVSRFTVSEPATPATRPLMDMQSGYLLRGAASMPRQGESVPFAAKQSYLTDLKVLGRRTYADAHLHFG